MLAVLRHFFLSMGVDKTYWIAFSGGLDSHVLLHLCCVLRDELSLSIHAIHVNHGLSDHAEDWVLHCRRVCDDYTVPFLFEKISMTTEKGDSLEEEARIQRYAVFSKYIDTHSVLLTAHHQDDQAETLFLQLIRGSGVKGLSAMPAVKSFSKGIHARPLLTITRAMLEKYGQTHGLHCIQDESNDNVDFSRNFVRHTILPELKKRWPTVVTSMARTARHCAEAQSLLDDYAASLLCAIRGSQPHTLSVSKLLMFDLVKMKLLLRAWIEESGHPLPDSKKLLSLCQTVLTAAPDKQPSVRWQTTIIRRYRDNLHIMYDHVGSDHSIAYEWNLDEPLSLGGLSKLVAIPTEGAGIISSIKQLTVRFRVNGEWVVCCKRGKRSLKRLFQEWGVPPWVRGSIPLLYQGERLVGVVGYYIAEELKAKSGDLGWMITSLP